MRSRIQLCGLLSLRGPDFLNLRSHTQIRHFTGILLRLTFRFFLLFIESTLGAFTRFQFLTQLFLIPVGCHLIINVFLPVIGKFGFIQQTDIICGKLSLPDNTGFPGQCGQFFVPL